MLGNNERTDGVRSYAPDGGECIYRCTYNTPFGTMEISGLQQIVILRNATSGVSPGGSMRRNDRANSIQSYTNVAQFRIFDKQNKKIEKYLLF